MKRTHIYICAMMSDASNIIASPSGFSDMLQQYVMCDVCKWPIAYDAFTAYKSMALYHTKCITCEICESYVDDNLRTMQKGSELWYDCRHPKCMDNARDIIVAYVRIDTLAAIIIDYL